MGQLIGLPKPKKTEEISASGLARLISSSRYCVVITGAGLSAESGIPTFRDPSDGIWKKYNVEDCGTIWGFKKKPEELWLLLHNIALCRPEPNAAHRALAYLERKGLLKCIITQNVDGLHQEAGSRNLIEIHGNIKSASCTLCKNSVLMEKSFFYQMDFPSNLPLKCSACEGILKPGVVLFGEELSKDCLNKAEEEIAKCDLLLIVGCSGLVSPVSFLPRGAKKNGAVIVEINTDATAFTNRVTNYLWKTKSSSLREVVDIIAQERRARSSFSSSN